MRLIRTTIKMMLPCLFMLIFIALPSADMINNPIKANIPIRDISVDKNQHKSNIIQEDFEISGEKTWDFKGYSEVKLPEYIIVYLKNDGQIVDMTKVVPNNEGKWSYSFTAPKYNDDETEIIYTVDEYPIDGFNSTVNGYDIINTYTGVFESPKTS